MSAKKSSSAVRTKTAPQKGGAEAAGDMQETSRRGGLLARLPWAYVCVFLFFFIFSTFIYGDMLVRTAEANFVTTDAAQMKHLLQREWGGLFAIARWGLVPFTWRWLGGALLALVLTLSTALTDRLFALPRRFRGALPIVPVGVVGWMIWRGTNLYHKGEPSLLIIVSLGALIGIAVLCALRLLADRQQRKNAPQTSRPATPAAKAKPAALLRILTLGGHPGVVISLLVAVGLSASARIINRDELATARMQLASETADWDVIIDEALALERPSRTAAAYYAVALTHTDQLLGRLFDLTFDFPAERLRIYSGNEEYDRFVADANFFAGLVNPAYRNYMDFTVMYGPNVYTLKRQLLCCILNGWTALGRKYVRILRGVPGTGSFLEKYEPMLADATLVDAEPTLARIKDFMPKQDAFEQQYRTPAFLGYNMDMLSGANSALQMAIASSLYSKDVPHAIFHINAYQQQFGSLPLIVQQALAVVAGKVPALQQQYGQVIASQQASLSAFLLAAKPLIDERLRLSEGKSDEEKERIKQEYNVKLREQLHDDWIGTYFYYYYCENNAPEQVRKATETSVN